MKEYQIRIYKTEIIEIFQHVIFHECSLVGSFIVKICIECSETDGFKNIYHRNIQDSYNIEIIDEPEYELKSSFPKEVILH